MSDTELWCRLCSKSYGEEVGFVCPKHPWEDLQPKPTHQSLRTMCWRCDTESTGPADGTCDRCRQSLVPPVLVIDFPVGPVILQDRSTSAMLGRVGQYGQLFAAHPNVSRRHATVGVDEAGDAWITPFPEAPNGTFVNDEEIGSRTVLRPTDRIRLATDRGPHPGPESQRIRQPFRER